MVRFNQPTKTGGQPTASILKVLLFSANPIADFPCISHEISRISKKESLVAKTVLAGRRVIL
jgi:hypothetical protein